MIERDPPARLPQIAEADLSEDQARFLGQWTGGIFQNASANPVLRTFAHHPALAEAFSPLNIHLLSANTLPVKLRQIAIMRTAWLCGATYMWSSHLNTSRTCGLSDDMYAPIQAGPDDPYFSAIERTVMRATDDLVRDHEVSESNWAALADAWDERQLLDFLFTVGCYTMVAGVMRSAGVERQDDLLELAGIYGAP